MPFKSIPAPFPVGHTPLFPLRRLDPGLSAQVSLWAKAEWYNPSGSVKDRPAWSILHTALNERRSDGAILEARAIHAADPARYFYADQYNNPANAQAHFESTGPEVWEDTHGHVSHFVAGLGTSGTMMGAGRFLRQRNPAIRLVAVQPDNAFNGLEGLKH